MEKTVKVPAGLYWSSRLVNASQGFWRRLGDLETRVLGDELTRVRVHAPIYVTSLARAGTTIVTEMLDRHADTTSHRYSDFPWLWTPYWRNYLRQRSQLMEARREERAHKDRIMVSADSPEAVEEILWNHFFPGSHDPDQSNVLDAATDNPRFERFYLEHQKKLLLVRQAKRYLAKGNYNISRLAYIHKLYPDARFVIPVRHPVNHIASLRKQHRFFIRQASHDARVGQQLQYAGHWEFGPGRRAVNYADADATARIQEAWSNGEEVRGWALLWQSTYQHLQKQLDNDPALARACHIFRYEDLCEDSAETIDAILRHCQLPASGYEAVRDEYIDKLSLPDYYQPEFTPGELEEIRTHCVKPAAWLGYTL